MGAQAAIRQSAHLNIFRPPATNRADARISSNRAIPSIVRWGGVEKNGVGLGDRAGGLTRPRSTLARLKPADNPRFAALSRFEPTSPS